MNLLELIVLFVVGLVLLIKGGDWFVDGSVAVARKFHLPELLIGATIVSIGTTLPEVMVSATGALNGQGEMAFGNAIGSVICNTALICAVTIAVRPSEVDRKSYFIPVIFFFGASLLYALIAYLTGFYYRWVGILLLAIFVGYIILQIILAKKNPEVIEVESEEETEEEKEKPFWQQIILLLLGAGCIAVGANFLVHYGTLIASKMGVPAKVIAITFVALGTSLPELVTAVTALIKGHSALSLGNIVGANLFNLVLVSGVSITLAPFGIPSSTMIAGINASLLIDLPVMFGVMLLLTVPALLKKRVSRYQGIILLLIYAAFCALQFILS